ncbi:type II toxin-antitoxin system RelE/ParE family toxin [Flavobacterium sp.]|uniref:type II toxin-antitoxin system RelE/ParE family toxin n=1 Tax=Flavobacterium sp. TaxID=239 RepID=UPI0035B2F2A5
MYSYDLSEKAKEDLLRIYEYGIGQFGLDQADKYFDMMHQCFDKIATNPFLFPTVSHIKSDYRKCVCGVDAIYFKIVVNSIEINTIIGRQDFEIRSLVH